MQSDLQSSVLFPILVIELAQVHLLDSPDFLGHCPACFPTMDLSICQSFYLVPKPNQSIVVVQYL